VTIDAERALVGSGPHCELQLPPEDAAPEHLLLEVRNGIVRGTARCLRPAPALNGVRFIEGRILPDSVMTIGSVSLTVSVEGAQEAAAGERRSTPALRTLLLAALAVSVGTYAALDGKTTQSTVGGPPPAPELWLAADTSCAQHNVDAALSSALDLRLVADGKRERSPFFPEDGVAAVPLYRRAVACFAAAGKALEAADANALAQQLQRRMLEDYRTHQVGLERALATNSFDECTQHVHRLASLLSGRSGAYVDWLSNVDRRVQLKVDELRSSERQR
jgi:hypothetical protein